MDLASVLLLAWLATAWALTAVSMTGGGAVSAMSGNEHAGAMARVRTDTSSKQRSREEASTAWWELLPETPEQIYSQNSEDGILKHLFQHLGTTNKYYVEFGTQDGSECNTRLLRERFGWHGLLMDSEFENLSIGLRKEWIYPWNIVSLFQKYDVPAEPDLVSVDVDSFDAFVSLEILKGGYRPRVLIVESNDNFGDDSFLSFPGDVRVIFVGSATLACGQPCRFWDSRGNGSAAWAMCGAGTRALDHVLAKQGYKLVYVNKVNMFFIRNDLAPEKMRRELSFERVMNESLAHGRQKVSTPKLGSCTELRDNLVDVRTWSPRVQLPPSLPPPEEAMYGHHKRKRKQDARKQVRDV